MATATDAATETNTTIMQNYCKTIGALAAASALVAGTAKAEIEYSINGGYHGEYIWRGIDFGKDMTTVGADIATEAYGLSLSAGIWQANFDAAIPFAAGQFSTVETDVYADISKDLGFWGLTGSVGYIKYIFDDTTPAGFGLQIDDAQEVYFGLSKDICYGIAADLTYYWDIETDNNGYLELGLAKTIDLDCSDCLSLGLETKLGYAVEQGEFANLVTSATLDWAFNDNATLSPYIALAIEGSENEVYESANEYNFVAGVSLEVTF